MAINVQPDQYVLGKGRFYFSRLINGVLEGYRFIGNVSAFTLTPSSTNLTHVASYTGLNVTDRDVVVSSDLAIGFTTDNMSQENKALWSGGTVDTVTQTALTSQTATITSPKKGYNYPVGTGAGFKDVTVTGITQGSTPLVAGTDYVVNTAAGLIGFPTSGALIDGTSVTVTYGVAASSKAIVNNRAQTITGAVKFISDNPDTGNGAVNEEHYLPSVRLSANGDWGLIGTDWQSFGFTGTVQQLTDVSGNPIPRHTITPLTAS